MSDNFKTVWNRWDQFKKGHIEESLIIPFIRDLMTIQAPAEEATKPNPYNFEIIQGKIVTEADRLSVK